jgi:hypothetical protein
MAPQTACRLRSRDSGIEEGAQKPSSVRRHVAKTRILGGFSLPENVLLLQRSGYWAKVVHRNYRLCRRRNETAPGTGSSIWLKR